MIMYYPITGLKSQVCFYLIVRVKDLEKKNVQKPRNERFDYFHNIRKFINPRGTLTM